jgi:tetratricopeptide (TPR) repeat protein
VYVHPLADFDEAIRMCEMALELAENDDEIVDALLLEFDALLGKGELEEAKLLCSRFPAGPFENPNHAFLVGRALYEIGDIERAAPLVEDAVKKNPANPEAHYYLGLVLDERGEASAATRAFLRSRELDLEVPPPSWTLTADTFLVTTQKALEGLDEQLRAFVRADEVYVCDAPGTEMVVDGVDPRALLLIDGVNVAPNTDRPTARIFVYQRNVERLAASVDLVEGEIRAALERELTAAFLGVAPEAEQSVN